MNFLWDDSRAPSSRDEVDELVYLSNLVGGDVTLIQPGGGNSSVKRKETDPRGSPIDVLRVKGSGTDMASVGRTGFSGLRIEDLGALARHDRMSDEEMMTFMRASMLDGREPSPSVETPLHAVLPFRFIVHTHDFATQALTDTARPEGWVRDALGNEVVYADYVRPGFPLALAVSRLGSIPSAAIGLVLGRHGLVAWADSAKDCYRNLHRLISRAEAFVAENRNPQRSWVQGPAAPSPAHRRETARALLPRVRKLLSARRPVILHHDDSPVALAFAGAPEAAPLAARGMATPEHILRCGRLPAHLGADVASLAPVQFEQQLAKVLSRFESEAHAAFARSGPGGEMVDPVPRVLILPGLGVVTAMKDKANAVIGATCYRHVIAVMEAAEGLGGFQFLDERDAIEFEHWPLELTKLRQPEKDLSRLVALVTGATTPIGAAVARKFAAEGAHLVLAGDTPAPLAELERAIALQCKDADRVRSLCLRAGDPVDPAVDQAVQSFGGLDIVFWQSPGRDFDADDLTAAIDVMDLQGRGTVVASGLDHAALVRKLDAQLAGRDARTRVRLNAFFVPDTAPEDAANAALFLASNRSKLFAGSLLSAREPR